MKSIKNLISLGYLLMALLVIGIMYIWYKEWCDLEKLEVQNRHIDTFRQESHKIFVLNDVFITIEQPKLIRNIRV